MRDMPLRQVIPIYEAMGAATIKPKDPRRKEKIDKLMRDDNYVGQRKLDGERLLTFHTVDSKPTAFGRGTSKYGDRMEKTGLVPHILKEIQLSFGDEVTVLDGEVLYIPPETSPRDIKLMNFKEDFWKCRDIMAHHKYPEEGVEQQAKEGWLHYFIFDVLACKGIDLIDAPYEDRLAYLDRITVDLMARGNVYIHVVPIARGTVAKKALLEKCLELGLEGIIVKKLKGMYAEGKKPANNWVKIKKSETADAVVIGYSDPAKFTEITHNGKKVQDDEGNVVKEISRFYTNNWIGAIWVAQWRSTLTDNQIKIANDLAYEIRHEVIDGAPMYLVPVAKISGITDALRAEISSKKQSFLFAVLELKYFDTTPDSYYQVSFVRFREDKNIHECIWEG